MKVRVHFYTAIGLENRDWEHCDFRTSENELRIIKDGNTIACFPRGNWQWVEMIDDQN